tara:strand:- start:2765 stop:3310 length:546 start_codon:yes stop_codon:yes gene_type:complete
MAKLAKIETKKIRISKDHLLREKDLLLSDLDKQDSRKQIIYTFLIFLFLGSIMLEGSGRNLAMAMVAFVFIGVSVYKNPEVLDLEKQISEIDQKLDLFDAHPEKIQSEFERKPKKTIQADTQSQSDKSSENEKASPNQQNLLVDTQPDHQVIANHGTKKSVKRSKKSKRTRRQRSKSNKNT